jgi:hypothetical protein
MTGSVQNSCAEIGIRAVDGERVPTRRTLDLKKGGVCIGKLLLDEGAA